MVNIIKTFRPAYCEDYKPSRVVRIWCLLISSLFYLTTAVNTTSAATYYLDAANGDDGNSGNLAEPWKTLAYALGTTSPVGPGDTVYLREGTYREMCNTVKYGTSGNWITIKGYPEETAVIDGTESLTDWTQAESNDPYLTVLGVVNPNYANIYWTLVEDSNFPNNLSETVFFEDRVMCRIASDPDQSEGFGEDTVEFRDVSAASQGQTQYFIDTTLTQVDDYWNDAIVRIFLHEQNASVIQRTVADYSVSNNKVTFNVPLDYPIHYDQNRKDRYRFVNHPHILDGAGESYITGIENIGGTDYRRIYYWPLDTDSLATKMAMAVRDCGFWSQRDGVAFYLIIEDLTIFGTKASGIRYDGKEGGDRSSHVIVRNCNITDCGNYGIYYLRMNNVVAEGNYVRRCGNNGIMGTEIDYCTFNGNDSGDNKGTGIDFYDVTNGMLINNSLRKLRGGHGNGSAVYGSGPGDGEITCETILVAGNQYYGTNMAFNLVRDLVVFNNLFRIDEEGEDSSQAITPWSSRYDGYQVFMNNTIPVAAIYALNLQQRRWPILWPDDCPQNYVVNNIFHGLIYMWYPEDWYDYDPNDVNLVDRTYNAYTSYTYMQTPGEGWNLQEGEQDLRETLMTDIFVDPTYPGDFQLKADGPLNGAGKNVQQILSDLGIIDDFPDYDFTKDLAGNPWNSNPSIGCYESNPSDPNNPTPVLQAIGDKSVDENVALIFTVNATDPNGEPITYSAQGLPTGATLDPLTGEFDWTPSYNQARSYQVTFRASDGNSQDSEIITITVNNVNRPPVIGAITDQSVDENDLLSISVNASDPDGQALIYSISGLPAGAVFVSQTLTWTPSYDQAGTFPVTFTVDDGQDQDSAAITITVINVNRTPVFAAIDNQSVWADDPLTFTVDATDPDGDPVTYSAGNLPSDATFTGQDFDWTPSQGQMGSYDVTFIASDGQLQDSQMVTITVDVDSLAPTVTNSLPTAGSIQVPLNNLITLNIADAGKGVDTNSVKIKVKTNSNPNNNTVYFGDMDHYISLLGDCRRIGSNADYKFVFQPTQDLFYYDQTVTITVNATDLAGNVMDEYSYSFATEMHSFGQNKQVNSGLDNNDRPVTVCDSSGNIWTAWHTGSIGNRDIYVSKLTAGADNFGSSIQLTDDATDQCNPAVALDSNEKLYVVWQDNREGDWDIYISTSVDGTNWSTEIRVNDPNESNQVNPAIVIDGQSPNQAHVVWQDDLAGNQDICIATSSDGFATKTVSQITTDSFDQVEPAVTADADNTIYVVWMDGRNGSNDIYGAASNNPWTNVAIVSNANNQSSPAIAAESTGSILHLLWVDDTLGDKDIYYASSDGLPGSPLTGGSIIDDSSGADQLEPAIAVTGSTGNDLKVFACWQDWRNTDTDLYFAELSSSSGTNVFVGDGGSSTYQGEPVIGIDEYSHPYLIWADNRSTNTEIYYAGSTFVEPVALASELVTASAPSSTTVGADPQAITTIDDVSVVVPAGACSYDVAITVTKIANPQAFAAPCLGGYDFGPSGIQFSQPVTITIPYFVSESNGSTLPYWYNSLTGALSQQGITDVQDIVISPTLHALSFKTTHFTAFYLLGGGAAVLGGGGGGGCSVSAGSEGNIVEFILPYIGLAVVMVILKMRDARERKARST